MTLASRQQRQPLVDVLDGAGLLAVGVSYPSPPGAYVYEEIDYAAPGAVLVGIGGAALVSGLVVYGLGMRKPDPRRDARVGASGSSLVIAF